MSKHILYYDGYLTSAERLLEGVMFEVEITEANGDLIVGAVNAPASAQGYLSAIQWQKFVPEIQTAVQENIDHLRKYAKSEGRTLSQELDKWHAETGEPRIDVLNEV